MTKLDCTVTNCFYNDDKCCCKGDIMVEGEEARESGSTCCGSFVEKKSSTAKNSVSQPKKDIEVGWQTKLVSPVRMPVSVRKQNV